VCGRRTGRPKISAVIWTIESLREPPPVARISVIGTPFFFSVQFAALLESEDEALKDCAV